MIITRPVDATSSRSGKGGAKLRLEPGPPPSRANNEGNRMHSRIQICVRSKIEHARAELRRQRGNPTAGTEGGNPSVVLKKPRTIKACSRGGSCAIRVVHCGKKGIPCGPSRGWGLSRSGKVPITGSRGNCARRLTMTPTMQSTPSSKRKRRNKRFKCRHDEATLQKPE